MSRCRRTGDVETCGVQGWLRLGELGHRDSRTSLKLISLLYECFDVFAWILSWSIYRFVMSIGIELFAASWIDYHVCVPFTTHMDATWVNMQAEVQVNLRLGKASSSKICQQRAMEAQVMDEIVWEKLASLLVSWEAQLGDVALDDTRESSHIFQLKDFHGQCEFRRPNSTTCESLVFIYKTSQTWYFDIFSIFRRT